MVTPKDWLRLVRCPGLGSGLAAKLLQQLGDASAIVDSNSKQLRKAGLSERAVEFLTSAQCSDIDADLAWLEAPDNHLLCLTEEDYPHLLRQTDRPPLALFVTGEPSVLWHPQIAVVGSRNPTAGGRRNARDFSTALSASNFVITSGLALGIDAQAHQSALDAGGQTIAVAGTGLDQVYPAQHQSLARDIVAAGGALVSEFPIGTPPRPSHFPQRNRIISGLSLATLVVEGGQRSGSLITARCASEQGREVFAIPGSIHNPLARGCHQLIRQGATLADDCTEMADAVRPLAVELTDKLRQVVEAAPDQSVVRRTDSDGSDRSPAKQNKDLDEDYLNLLEALGYDPMSVDAIVENTQLTPESVSSMLLILELDGLVQACPGSRYCRT